jgi:hypothetical protein
VTTIHLTTNTNFKIKEARTNKEEDVNQKQELVKLYPIATNYRDASQSKAYFVYISVCLLL